MNEAIVFDSHGFIKNLTASGFTEKQAEALAKEHTQFIEANLATKADIAAIRADIETIRAELEVKIQESKVDLLKWMLTAMIAQGALIVTLVKLL